MYKLVIVESPNKIKAIQGYLGNDYKVMASVGHIVKLPSTGKYGLGIDLDKWEPQYKIDPKKKNVVDELKKASKKASEVIIATDPDREGEAIGQNLVDFLDIKNKSSRVRYNAITKATIQAAFSNISQIDDNLVTAQKVRRMLDRIIGYRLSNLMKFKLSNTPTNPSAGRVQSIALKLVVDRERVIQAFVPEQYFYIAAYLDKDTQSLLYLADNFGDKNWIEKDAVDGIMYKLSNTLEVSDIKITSRKDAKATPFKQAIFYRRSSLSAKGAQASAQRLFEGYGDDGLITYPRTDSTVYSTGFVEDAKKYITKTYGEQYWDGNIRGVAGDQNAHEAIRPTDLSLTPARAKMKYGTLMNNDDFKTYQLIYENALKSIMSQPEREYKSFTFNNNGYEFKHSQNHITFDGYYKAIGLPVNDGLVLDLNVGDKLEALKIEKQAKETQPPARYNDGSLIEELDNIKVGRPSTFATTVNVIKTREYVTQEGKALKPTEFGTVVIDKLIEGFPKIINEAYTAEIETDLDEISEGKRDFRILMDDFWDRFDQTMEIAFESLDKTVLIPVYLEEKCPNDQGLLSIKKSRYGKFIGCSNYPNCKYTRNVEHKRSKQASILERMKKAPTKVE